jgi:LCP family protein required for cell wall assembly
VKIPGTNSHDRINSTFGQGPALLIQTITAELGIPIDYFAEVNFDGFRKIVFAVGGVEICFPGPERDSYSGLDITQAGCQVLDPNLALAFVRARHLEIQRDGVWGYDPTSDFGRMSRQQQFVRQLAKRAQAGGFGELGRMNEVLRALPEALQVDSRLSFNEMTRLARRLRQNGDAEIQTLTLDLHGIYMGGIEAAVLQMKQPDADLLLREFRDFGDAEPPVPLVRQPAHKAVGF